LSFERHALNKFLLRIEHTQHVGRGQPVEVDLVRLLPNLKIGSIEEFYLAGDYTLDSFTRLEFKTLPQDGAAQLPKETDDCKLENNCLSLFLFCNSPGSE